MKLIRIRCKESKKMVLKQMTLEDVVNAFENLVYKNAIETYGEIKMVQHNVDEVEDINVLGMIELIKCYESYDCRKGAFSTYLDDALKKLSKRIQRDLYAEKRVSEKTIISLEGNTEELDAFQELMGAMDEDLIKTELDYDVVCALEQLNEEERKIIGFLMQEIKTKKEFAKELGITRPTLDTRIAKTKEKMLHLLNGNVF